MDIETINARLVEALNGDAFLEEQRLHVLKLNDTVLRAGWHPYQYPGQEIAYELMKRYEMEAIEGDERPIVLAWLIADEMGYAPDFELSAEEPDTHE